MKIPTLLPQPLHAKSNRKLAYIGLLTCALVIVFCFLFGYVAGRTYSNGNRLSVLGAHTPDTTTNLLAILLNTIKPPLETNTTQMAPIITTPTPTSMKILVLPSPTPTISNSPVLILNSHPMLKVTTAPPPQYIAPNGNTISSPAGQNNLNPLPETVSSKTILPPSQVEQLIAAGITVIQPKISTNAGTLKYTVQGVMHEKIFGLIPVSYPVSVYFDKGIVTSIARPWWGKFLTNFNVKFINPLGCASITDPTICKNDHKDYCWWWPVCGKCYSLTPIDSFTASVGPPDSSCYCSNIKTHDACKAKADSCEWHQECDNGITCTYNELQNGCSGWGACATKGSSEVQACGSCDNIGTGNSCYSQTGCTWHGMNCIDSHVGSLLCTDKSVSDYELCGGCENISSPNTCQTAGCTWYNTCQKCGYSYTLPDPSCSCSTITLPGNCKMPQCAWHPECSKGAVCVDQPTNSYGACGGCSNITEQYACNNNTNYECHYYTSCGKCGNANTPPDPSCTN